MPIEIVRRQQTGQTVDVPFAAHESLLGMGLTVKTKADEEKEAYVITCLCMLIVVTVIFRNRGFYTCSTVVTYLAALSSMSLVLKNVFVEQQFDFPVWVTGMHFLCTGILAFGILAYRAHTTGTPITRLQPNTFLQGVAPMALCMSMSIGLSNKGLSISNVHFSEMVDTAAPLVTALITVMMGTAFNTRLLLPLGLVTCALVCCWSLEAEFSWLAFAYLLAGTVLRACKGVMNQMYLTAFTSSPTQVLDPVELVMYTCLTSCFLMGAWSFALDGSEPFHLVWLLDSSPARCAITLSIVIAIVINFAGIFIIRDLGAVAQQLTNNLKGGLSVLGGVAVRGEVLSVRQAMGFAFLICGIAWYNNMDKQLQENEKCEHGRETQKLLKKGKGGGNLTKGGLVTKR